MGYMNTFPMFFLLSFNRFISFSDVVVTVEIRNQCPYTVWAAASSGGGCHLDKGHSWTLNVAAGSKNARIWGRTNCNFNANGNGKCQTGDCGGVLVCKGSGKPPNTLAEYTLNQFGKKDFYDISLVEGFNIPMDFSPTNGRCQGIKCTADINGQCPGPLKVPHGCNNPCTVFKRCGPTDYSKFFKKMCPNAYSYAEDDPTNTLTCSPVGLLIIGLCFAQDGRLIKNFLIDMYWLVRFV